MPLAREQRKLAAILAADVVGYSRLMGRDESGTLARLRKNRSDHLDPVLAKYGGRLVKLTGDGALIEFSSAVDALSAAIEFQQVMAEANADQPADGAMVFRMGLHLGDLIVDGDDLYGDGVNIAARLEAEAPAGGILVSGNVRDAVAGRLKAAFEDLGDLALKNIERPIRAFRVHWEALAWRPVAASEVTVSPAMTSQSAPTPLELPDKPSIAVLPFQNMSGDPEQEYFADGMVEEIITALSRFKSLFVIARNSSFTFKGKAVDIKEVGRNLGVRYVLEGSVRKASGKVRVTGQLIDAATGTHLWADRFERDLTDIFALQDEVTVAVVSAVQPKLLQTEIARATRRRPENLTAYDLCLRAMQQHYRLTRESLAEAATLARRALELDPRFGFAAALAGTCHMQNFLYGYAIDPQFERAEAVRLLNLALGIDDGDPDTLAWASLITAIMVGDYERASEMADRAVELNPNSYFTWLWRGQVYRFAGMPEEAVVSYKHAIRASPMDPLLYMSLATMGQAFIELRCFEEAIVAAKKALHQNSTYPAIHRCLASAFAHLGRNDEAREAAARVLELEPDYKISTSIARGRYSNLKLLIEGLRKAGLPE
jgi:adenylate cyclase